MAQSDEKKLELLRAKRSKIDAEISKILAKADAKAPKRPGAYMPQQKGPR